MFTTTTPWIQYSGNDVTTAFPFAHKIYDQGDVVVTLKVDATAVVTLQTITTHYTVADVATNAHDATTPTITMLTPPATGETLTIYRMVDLIQNTSFATTQLWRSLSAEQQNDLFVMMVQYQQLQLDRCAKGSLSSAAVTTTLEAILTAVGILPLSSLVNKATLVAGDLILIGDSEDSGASKNASLTNLSTFLQTLYFLESEHINTSAGAGDAGKPIKLDANGEVNSNMIPDGSDATAIHDNVAAEISALSAVVLADDDSFIVEDLDAGTPNSKLKCLASAIWTYILGKLDAGKYAGALQGQIEVTFDGGGSVLTTGAKKVYIKMPCAGTITQATLVADQSGSLVIDVWKDTYANFPPTVADTITASAKPTLSAAQKSQDATLTGWTKTFSEGDIMEFNIDSVATITKAILTLDYDKTGA